MVPNGGNIVDIGCGKGIYGFLLRTQEINNYMVGVDIERRHLLFCLKHKIYDDVILADATCLPFRKSSFKIVLASEVIEHIEKSKGKVFLKELERICNCRIILTTPNGYFPFSLELYPYETHKSTYSASELKRFGYKVFGIGFKGSSKLGRMGLLGTFLGWAFFTFLLQSHFYFLA
jgi:ubiquinone/menaquinone biosynthesis C-methylase UbiE